tara:strand:- start:127 stop:474 length:348 start_codon:yes stop_codon:yes gene_type:complete
LGKPEKALEEIVNAKRIDPFCPDILFEDEGICYYWLDRLLEAAETFNKLQIPTRNSLFYLAATYNQIGDADKASTVLKEASSMSNLGVEEFVQLQKYKDANQSQKLLDTLSMIPT